MELPKTIDNKRNEVLLNKARILKDFRLSIMTEYFTTYDRYIVFGFSIRLKILIYKPLFLILLLLKMISSN